MEVIDSIDLSIDGAPSLVLRDLSEYATLAYLAAFDVQDPPLSNSTISASKQVYPAQKRVTYVALSKKTMPMLVDLFLRFQGQITIYIDGTLEIVLSVRSQFYFQNMWHSDH